MFSFAARLFHVSVAFLLNIKIKLEFELTLSVVLNLPILNCLSLNDTNFTSFAQMELVAKFN